MTRYNVFGGTVNLTQPWLSIVRGYNEYQKKPGSTHTKRCTSTILQVFQDKPVYV